MGLFGRRSRGAPKDSGSLRGFPPADLTHLRHFVSTRVGVEAYVEPATSVTQTTVAFVATSGEWTRRRVAGPAQAQALAKELGIPVYDATIVGYPARMRAWTTARTRAERAHRSPGH